MSSTDPLSSIDGTQRGTFITCRQFNAIAHSKHFSATLTDMYKRAIGHYRYKLRYHGHAHTGCTLNGNIATQHLNLPPGLVQK